MGGRFSKAYLGFYFVTFCAMLSFHLVSKLIYVCVFLFVFFVVVVVVFNLVVSMSVHPIFLLCTIFLGQKERNNFEHLIKMYNIFT